MIAGDHIYDDAGAAQLRSLWVVADPAFLAHPEESDPWDISTKFALIGRDKLCTEKVNRRGAGAAFCTGLDLKEAADPRKAHATAEMVARTLIAISQTRLITIAAVHGAAVAGGAGIMSACDFVVAAQGTRIGYPEVRRGLVAGLVLTFLRRQVGERNMRELLLGSELNNAERAKEIGLVHRVVAQNDFMSEIQKFADSILQSALGALAQTKRLIEELW